MVGKVVLDAGIALYKKVFPAPPPPPTVKFGTLTKIPFPDNGITAKLSYTLETPEGGLPTTIPTQAKVFFMPKINPTLLSLDVATEKARAMDFDGTPEQISDTIYRFGTANFPSILEMNIVTGTFSISYDLVADRSPIDQKPPVSDVAATRFKAFLTSADILPEDLTGPITHEFFRLSEGRLAPAISLSESDVIKVNLFRKAYDELPSLTGNPNEANVWGIMSGATTRNQQIIAAEYHYFPVDETQFSTYPIKTPSEAYNELTNGTPFIADLGLNKDGGALKIRRIYLAYFDPEVASDFFQPIYVFEGDNGFIAYIPAVTADYYGE